ncbi:MAG TPA: hypothetical protein PKM88_06615 [bacterium]|nr:hypothetical protein [bacterium]
MVVRNRLQALAREWRAQLRWPVLDKISMDPGEQAAMVMSDPEARQHVVVRSPQRLKQSPWYDLEMLHALVRAQLAESSHPLFAAAWLTNATDIERAQLTPFLLAAGGWFTIAVMMTLCPDAQRRYNAHVVDALKKATETQGAAAMSEQQLVLLALALAAYKKHNAPTMPLAPQACSLRDYTLAFLATPTAADVRHLTALANALLAVYADYQVELTATGKGFDAWRLCRGEQGDTPA